MEPEKTGKFITALRKERGLTQKELADKIGVTDKAVSKWETGRGFPDVAVLEILAKELDVSVTELMSGERSTPETVKAQSDNALIETLLYVRRMSRKTLGTLLIVAGACMLCSPLVLAGNFLPIFIVGIFLTVGGVFMLISKRSIVLPKIVFEGVSLATLAAALVLEILPDGVILWWATPPGKPLHSTMHSYFDLLPFGVAMFPPFITAVFTVVVMIFTIVVMLLGKRFVKPRNALFVCLIVTTAISACPVLYGFKYVTAIGVGITLLLAASAVSRAFANSY